MQVDLFPDLAANKLSLPCGHLVCVLCSSDLVDLGCLLCPYSESWTVKELESKSFEYIAVLGPGAAAILYKDKRSVRGMVN